MSPRDQAKITLVHLRVEAEALNVMMQLYGRLQARAAALAVLRQLQEMQLFAAALAKEYRL